MLHNTLLLLYMLHGRCDDAGNFSPIIRWQHGTLGRTFRRILADPTKAANGGDVSLVFFDSEQADTVRRAVNNILQQAEPPEPNITKEMQDALEHLKEDESIMVWIPTPITLRCLPLSRTDRTSCSTKTRQTV